MQSTYSENKSAKSDPKPTMLK